MRHLKMWTVAAMAVFALAAFAGAGTASATVLCSTSSNPCTGTIYGSGTTITGSVDTNKAVLTTSGGIINPTITCATSNTTLQTTSAGGSGSAVTGNVTALSFSSCTSVNPSGCSSSATSITGLPASGSASLTTAPNGTLSIPTAPVVSFSCPVFGSPVTCSFGGNSISGTIHGGNPADIAFTNATINSTGGFGCPTSAKWTAKYVANNGGGSNPTSIYVADH